MKPTVTQLTPLSGPTNKPFSHLASALRLLGLSICLRLEMEMAAGSVEARLIKKVGSV